MSKDKVLITGGSGFLGTYLVSYLSKNFGHKLIIFDKLPPNGIPTRSSFIEYRKGDVMKRDEVDRVFIDYGPFKTVYHLASAMPNKTLSDELTWNTNVIGATNIVDAARTHKTETIVFTSSNVTYGIPEVLPVSETSPLKPIEIYGKSKLEAEKILEKRKGKMNVQIFRCPVIVGSGRLGLQGILFEFISENKNVYLLGAGSNIYQFVDANDVCSALELASHKKGFDIYTIGADEILPLYDIYKRVIEHAKSTSKIVPLPYAPAIAILKILDKLHISPLGIYQYSMLGQSMYANTQKIKKTLHWKPNKTNAESFIDNFDWYIKHKREFVRVGDSNYSDNRSLPKLGIFQLLKLLS